jgi:hypothetical protein
MDHYVLVPILEGEMTCNSSSRTYIQEYVALIVSVIVGRSQSGLLPGQRFGESKNR